MTGGGEWIGVRTAGGGGHREAWAGRAAGRAGSANRPAREHLGREAATAAARRRASGAAPARSPPGVVVRGSDRPPGMPAPPGAGRGPLPCGLVGPAAASAAAVPLVRKAGSCKSGPLCVGGGHRAEIVGFGGRRE